MTLTAAGPAPASLPGLRPLEPVIRYVCACGYSVCERMPPYCPLCKKAMG